MASTTDYFCGLPPELRNAVYDLLLHDEEDERDYRMHGSILRVNKLLKNEFGSLIKWRKLDGPDLTFSHQHIGAGVWRSNRQLEDAQSFARFAFSYHTISLVLSPSCNCMWTRVPSSIPGETDYVLLHTSSKLKKSIRDEAQLLLSHHACPSLVDKTEPANNLSACESAQSEDQLASKKATIVPQVIVGWRKPYTRGYLRGDHGHCLIQGLTDISLEHMNTACLQHRHGS